MNVILRTPARKDERLQGRRQVADILQAFSLQADTYIVYRGEQLLNQDDWVEDTDTVEVMAAVSGGGA